MTAAPAMNFVFLIACPSGFTNDFTTFLWPFDNGYGRWFENQAVAAFTVSLPATDTYWISCYFHQRLVLGYGARESPSYMVDRLTPMGRTTQSGGSGRIRKWGAPWQRMDGHQWRLQPR